jgi:diguanylate cyclase (GGDEF)-like protein
MHPPSEAPRQPLAPLDPIGLAPDLQVSSRSAESRLLRLMMAVGGAVVALIGAIEYTQGVMAPWDRWFQPVLALGLLVGALRLWRRPDTAASTSLVAVLLVNAYLVATLQMHLFGGHGVVSRYQMLTTLYWVPLGCGVAFVFLSTRAALAISAAVFVAIFGPIVFALAHGPRAEWGDDFGAMTSVLSLAQVVYVVLLSVVGSMRAGYHRAAERVHVVQLLASTDVLTGLSNRRALSETLQAALAGAVRQRQPLSVLLIDVDHFKRINDGHGHQAGDAALQRLAALLARTVRQADRVGRWGGEEFLVVAPGNTATGAMELAERLRMAVRHEAFDHGVPVTVSVGVAELATFDSVETLVHRADVALYQAKLGGRDRCVVRVAMSDPTDPPA